MSSVVYTLYEGHYALGVGALLNSLVNNQFSGDFVVGFKGSLPVWTQLLERTGNNEFKAGSVTVKFISVNTNMHLTYYKPYFGLELATTLFPQADHLFYFDPDVVVKTNWAFFEDWVTKGVALCLDNCYHLMPSTHPWRHEWIKIGNKINLQVRNPQNYYCNAGFFGVSRSHLSFLELWSCMTTAYAELGGDVTTMKKQGRTQAVVGDQDIMNGVMMFTEVPLSMVGPEGMDFGGGGYIMSHAVYNVKPWKRNFTVELFKTGNAPSLADKEFMKNISHPVKVFPQQEAKRRQMDIKVASLLGRFIGR